MVENITKKIIEYESFIKYYEKQAKRCAKKKKEYEKKLYALKK